MSTTLETPEGGKAPSRAGTALWGWAMVGVLIVAGWGLVAQANTRVMLLGQIQEANDRIAALDTRAALVEQRFADTRAQLAAALASTAQAKEQLERERGIVEHLTTEQHGLVRRFGGHVADQEKQIGSITGEVGAVRTEVADNRRDLQRAIGDLGEQGGRIARNHDELQALIRRGERQYVEFKLAKSPAFTHVGPLSLRLNKADDEHQRYTLTVVANDRQIEKKDKTLLEPVQFYMPGDKSLREIVVYRVGNDQIEGYVSLPKEVVASNE
jgi:hypothetical protein